MKSIKFHLLVCTSTLREMVSKRSRHANRSSVLKSLAIAGGSKKLNYCRLQNPHNKRFPMVLNKCQVDLKVISLLLLWATVFVQSYHANFSIGGDVLYFSCIQQQSFFNITIVLSQLIKYIKLG